MALIIMEFSRIVSECVRDFKETRQLGWGGVILDRGNSGQGGVIHGHFLI